MRPVPRLLASLLCPLLVTSAVACGDDGAAPGNDTAGPGDTDGPKDTGPNDTSGGTNSPPELERIGDRTVAVNKTLSITLSAKDPDNDPLTYSVFGNLPEGARFDKADHRFEWAPKEAGKTVFLTFVVSDGTDFDRETVRIQVTETATSSPPSFVEVGDQILPLNQPYTLELSATDPDGDGLTYGHEGTLPAGANLDTRTGEFTWRPGPEAVGEAIRITFTVSDGTGSDSMPVRFVVDDGSGSVPKPPVFQNIAPQTARVGQPLTVELDATDPNGDAITFAIQSGAPPGATLSGRSFGYTAGAGEVGQTFEVAFSATDGTFTAVAKMKLSVVSGQTGSCTPDAAEPNESPAEAKPLTLGTSSANLCETESTYDTDFYAVTIGAGEELRAKLTFDGNKGDLDLILVDASESFLALSDGVSSTEELRYAAPNAMTAYLVVTGYALEPLDVGYTLETSVSAASGCVDDGYEDNDTPSAAKALDGGAQSTTLQICASDADFWTFPVTCGQRVEVLMDITGQADLDLYLYDETSGLSEPVAAAITEETSEYIDHPAAARGGTWLLEVSGYPFASAESGYEVIVDTTGGCADDGQNNGARQSAKILDKTGAPLTNLAVCCTDDWFAIQLAAGETVMAELTVSGGPGLPAVGAIAYGPDGVTQLASKAPSESGGLLLFTATTAGNHFIKVSGAVGTRYGLAWEVEAGGSGCTRTSCPKYDVCDSAQSQCVSDFCGSDAECPGGYVCRETYCVDACSQSTECRAGYACKAFDDASYCGIAGAGQTGASCSDHTACANNYACLFQPRGGYCAERGCTSCDAGTKCATVNGQSFCAKTCNTAADCRGSEGYTCSAEKTCLPQNP